MQNLLKFMDAILKLRNITPDEQQPLAVINSIAGVIAASYHPVRGSDRGDGAGSFLNDPNRCRVFDPSADFSGC